MIDDDFSFDSITGKFTDEPATTIAGEIVLRLTAKACSSKIIDGIPAYSGDWFFNPLFGNQCYEIKTTSTDVLNTVKNRIELALKQVLKKEFVDEIIVDPQFDLNNSRRINVNITVNQSNAEPVTYTHFVEVG